MAQDEHRVIVVGNVVSIKYEKDSGSVDLLPDSDVFLSSCGTETVTMYPVELAPSFENIKHPMSFQSRLSHSCNSITRIELMPGDIVVGGVAGDQQIQLRWHAAIDDIEGKRYVIWSRSISSFFDDESARVVYDDCGSDDAFECKGIELRDFIRIVSSLETW